MLAEILSSAENFFSQVCLYALFCFMFGFIIFSFCLSRVFYTCMLLLYKMYVLGVRMYVLGVCMFMVSVAACFALILYAG